MLQNSVSKGKMEEKLKVGISHKIEGWMKIVR